jgi:hypothetical protein
MSRCSYEDQPNDRKNIWDWEKNLLKDPKSLEGTLQTVSWWTIWKVSFFHAYGTYVLSIRVFSYGCHANFTLVFISHSRKLGFIGDC